MAGNNALLKVTGLYQNRSAKGETYFTGYWGGTKIVILRNKDRKSDKDPAWNLFLTERPQKQSRPTDANSLPLCEDRSILADEFNDPIRI